MTESKVIITKPTVIIWGDFKATIPANEQVIEEDFCISKISILQDIEGCHEFIHAIHAALKENKPIEVKHRSDWGKKREKKISPFPGAYTDINSAGSKADKDIALPTKSITVPEFFDEMKARVGKPTKEEVQPRLETRVANGDKPYWARYGNVEATSIIGLKDCIEKLIDSLNFKEGDLWPADMHPDDRKTIEGIMEGKA